MSVTVADLKAKFSADTKELESGVKRAERSVNQLSRETRRASDEARRGGSSFGGFGSATSAAFGPLGGLASTGVKAVIGIAAAAGVATAGVVALGASFVSAANELNAGFANVASLGVANGHIVELKSNVQDMSILTGKTTDDLTAGLYQVVSAFGDTADTSKILEINAKAAVGGVASTLDAINLSSAVTKGYGDTSAEAVMKVSDLALKTVELGQTTFPELAASIGKVVPLSKELGISQEELFAVMATGSGVTGTASEVSTQYRGILQSFMAPTSTATKLFESMGFASGEAMIQQLGFADAVRVMVAASEQTGLPLQEFIGSIEGQTLALALAGAQSGKYQSNLQAMASAAGKTDAAFAAQTQGVNKIGFKLTQAANWWTAYRQKAGDAINRVAERLLPSIEPALVGLAGRLEGFIPVAEAWANDVTARMQSAFAEAGGGVAGFAAALSNLPGGSITYDAKAQITETSVLWGAWTHTYDAKGEITQDSVLWGAYTHTYNAKSKVDETSVLWGAYTHTYFASAQITEDSVLWGAYTHTYNAKSQIDETSVFWGVGGHVYDAKAKVGEQWIWWGAWTHTYDVGAKVGETSVLWGAWTHSYDGKTQISETSVLWGAWTHSYDAQAKVGEQSLLWGAWSHEYQASTRISETDVLWGAWTNTYDARAQVGEKSVLWGLWTNTYDAQGNLTSLTIAGQDPGAWLSSLSASWVWPAWPAFVFPALPIWAWPAYAAWAWPTYEAWAWPALPVWAWPDIPTPSWLSSLLNWRPSIPWFGGGEPAQNASGTDNFRGGWTWVGEQGPELLNLPAGSRILSNPNSMRLIGQMAAGNVVLPGGVPASVAGGVTAAPPLASNLLAGINKFASSVGKMDKSLEKFNRNLEGMLSKVPGLFGQSQVTQEQMDLAKLGVPQNFADDWLRHMADEVFNGVDWADVDLQDAAQRAGIDPALPAEAIYKLVAGKWNDQSLFAGGKNTDLINQDAVQQSLQRQRDAASGQSALMALFGVTPQQAFGEAVAVGGQISAGVSQGMISTGSATGGLSGGVINNLAAGITPEAAAPIAQALATSITTSLSQGAEKDKGGGASFGDQFIGAVSAQLASSDTLADVGPSILDKITSKWGSSTTIDFAGRIASAVSSNLGSKDATGALLDVGERIFAIVLKGWEKAARGADYISSVADGAGSSQPAASSSSTTTTTPPPPRDSGRANDRLALAYAAAGPVTHNHYYNVNSQLDYREVARRVLDIIKRG